MSRYKYSMTLVFLTCSSIWIVPGKSSDPDPMVDSSVSSEWVLRDVYSNGVVSNGPGGQRAALNVTQFPALTNATQDFFLYDSDFCTIAFVSNRPRSQGLTLVHFHLKPCGENLPHTHPRATELLTMISGGPIQAGLIDTSGTAHIYILNPGDLIVFPRGLLHYEMNMGTETAFFISALNSQNPGVLTAATAFLKLPDRAAAAALNQDLETIAKLKHDIYPYKDQLQVGKRSGCVPGLNVTADF